MRLGTMHANHMIHMHGSRSSLGRRRQGVATPDTARKTHTVRYRARILIHKWAEAED